MTFKPVNPGTFRMGSGNRIVTVTLTNRFEMMTTEVTQKHWFDINGYWPTDGWTPLDQTPEFVENDFVVVQDSRGNNIRVRPNSPIERINWEAAIKFANKASIRAGLPPAYDLSQAYYSWNELHNVRINAPNGDIYQARGYRLPTEAEMEYVLRLGGRSTGEFFFGNDVSQLGDYAWFRGSAHCVGDVSGSPYSSPRCKRYPVGLRNPLVLDGQEFFDLLGNVAEMMHDYAGEPIAGGVNPVTVEPQRDRIKPHVVKGGSVHSLLSEMGATFRSSIGGGGESAPSRNDVGFRLVRTLHPN